MASFDDESWKDEVREKLIAVFEAGDDDQALLRVLWYLDEEDQAYKDEAQAPPAWRSLKATLRTDKAFKQYAERMAEDTKRAEKDVKFRETMNIVYTQMMDACEEPVPEEEMQGFDLAKLGEFDLTQTSGFIGLARSWALIPRAAQMVVREAIVRISTPVAISVFDDVVSLVNKAGGNVVMFGLAAVQLGYAAIKNIRRWWNGDISGRRCAKNVVDSALTVTASVGGGMAGAAIGTMFGPFGTIIGGVTGSLLSAQTAQFLADRLTQLVFGIPREEALENAYNYFGTNMTASNSEINGAFRKLCLKHHPDKGGQTEDFLIVQSHMSIIKMGREC